MAGGARLCSEPFESSAAAQTLARRSWPRQEGEGNPEGDPLTTQRPQTPIPVPLLDVAQSMSTGLDQQQDSNLNLLGEPPDLHTQRESMFHAGFKAEADARFVDRIDRSMGVRLPKSRF
jgi:hypothetical protein